jgi:raffinose/stachyose/melibiose transport system substrate-binding protein
MKRKLAGIMAAVMAAATLISGCSGGNSKTTAPGAGNSENASGKEIQMTFPTYLAGENVGAVFFLPEVERFNQKYAGKYKIVIEEVPQAQYAEKIKQLAQQNKLPAIVHAPGSGGIDLQWFKSVVLANGMAYDLSEFANANPEVKNNWIDDSMDYCTVDGKLICKPLSVLKPVGLYYNNTMYKPEKVVKDMKLDEFMESIGDNKFAFQTAENAWTSGLLLTALIANQEGGETYLAQYVDDKLYDYTDAKIVSAISILQKLLQSNASANTIGAAYADAANAFMSKSAAIICNGSWMASDFDEESADKWSNGFTGEEVTSDIYPGNFAIANPRVFGEFWIANTASDEEKELAKAFFAFRDSKEEIEQLVLTEGGVAPKLDYSDEFLKKQAENRILSQLAESMDENTRYTASIFDVMPASVADTEFGKLLPKLADGTLTPEEFCSQLTQKAEEAKN